MIASRDHSRYRFRVLCCFVFRIENSCLDKHGGFLVFLELIVTSGGDLMEVLMMTLVIVGKPQSDAIIRYIFELADVRSLAYWLF